MSTRHLRLFPVVWVVLLAAACQAQPPPAAPPARPAEKPLASPAAKPADTKERPEARPGWQAEWERTVAAAKQEGRVVVAGPPGDAFREASVAFEKTYPDIKVDYTGLSSGREFIPKVLAERRSGLFLWDVHVGGATDVLEHLLPEGVLERTKDMLIRPEIWDDGKWLNGFDWGFQDRARERVFSPIAYLEWSVNINRDVIREPELSRLEELLDPRYRGRVSWNDPRSAGAGSFQAAIIMQAIGKENLRKLYAEQEILVTRDGRQQAEWLVRGTYPIAVGVPTPNLDALKREGLGANVRPMDATNAVAVVVGSGGCFCVLTKAPHPNAARVYLDWLLSQEGQATWSSLTPHVSRRLDVKPRDPGLRPKPDVGYFLLGLEENRPGQKEATEVAIEALP